MLACPRCNLHRKSDPALPHPLCPRCQTVGKEVYLEAARDFEAARDPVIAGRPRYDVFGLLATARSQLHL